MKSIRLEDEEKYIHRKKKVTLEDLMETFDVSMNTVRRDVKELLKKGTIKKVYGGVESLEINSEEKYLNPFDKRSINNITAKEKIARKAAEFINEGDTIFIDSGSTTVSIMDHIDKNMSLIVVTNSLDVINKVIKYPNIELLVPASLYKNKTKSFVEWDMGESSILDKLNIDKAFMAASSILGENVMNASTAEYTIKNKVMQHSFNKYLLLDSSKYDTRSFLTYATIDEFDKIITDGIPGVYKGICDKYKIDVEII